MLRTLAAVALLLAGWQLGAAVTGGEGPFYVYEAERLRFIWRVLILDGGFFNWLVQTVLGLLILAVALLIIHALANAGAWYREAHG